ncbi:DUF4397 domain-containing protein [Aquipuribacter nitratireducens]|uniref:DUF4397 domain-containing protein n=1 Tax=Aquipuribacter nitratireducens TaxID=650104 RepID=A0ABW0GI43_9MICO
MRTILAATGAALLPLAFAAPAAASGSGDAQVAVFHGVPGLTVDVYANGDVLLEDFEPGTITDPLTLPAGSYDLAVYPAGADPEADDAAIEQTAEVPAGANVTVAAHLDESGAPVLTPFVNDTSEVAAGEGRLTVRHTAAAPAVDVLAGGDPVFTGLTNPNEETADLPAGTVEAAVALAGTTDPVLGPADVDVAEGVNTIVYAYGSAEEGTLDLAIQTISGLGSSPSGVPSGTGGLVSDAFPWQLAVVGALGAGAVVLLGGRAVAARSARD